jgi:hypothetical protein
MINLRKNIALRSVMISLAILAMASCNKFLDAKPDKSLAIPTTLADYQALIDNRIMAANFPVAGDIASDDYYLTNSDWAALSTPDLRNTYIYDGTSANDLDYTIYQYVTNSNVIIEGTGKGGLNANSSEVNAVAGSGYFFRGYCFLNLASVFTLPYRPGTTAMGIPLKLRADITSPTSRSTLEETYQQIISDFRRAADLLPVQVSVKTRPSKPAAYGALARTYLIMRNFEMAGKYADSCLQLYSTLIDYNTVSTTSNTPFPLFNNEVIFHATSSGRGGVVSLARARVDSLLYNSYSTNDLRKRVFFRPAPQAGQLFKGDYGATTSASHFGGVASDEMYLIRAECFARSNDVIRGVTDLNTLMQKRWAQGTFVPYSSSLTPKQLLDIILTERRKELLFRNQSRWNDLRRLNQEPDYQKTLVRQINSVRYTMAPDSKNYAYLFPVSVIQQTGIQQNDR